MTGIQLTDYDIAVKVVKDSAGMIASGLVLGDILAQNQALILRMHKGELHEDPSVGVGIEDMLLDRSSGKWERVIREQLELDGQKVNSVEITGTQILIDSNY